MTGMDVAHEHQMAVTEQRPYVVSKWQHARLPGNIKSSHRQVFWLDNRLLVEEIVLEEIPLTVEDNGTEKTYPQLRRRK